MLSSLDDEQKGLVLIGGLAAVAAGAFVLLSGKKGPPEIFSIHPTTYSASAMPTVYIVGKNFTTVNTIWYSANGWNWNHNGVPADSSMDVIHLGPNRIELPAGANQVPATMTIKVQNAYGTSNPVLLSIVG